ncbi:MAG: OstA family protein [Candidatus Binatus sp.]|nr:OstA family protein [Candidatus Binatus sp.]
MVAKGRKSAKTSKRGADSDAGADGTKVASNEPASGPFAGLQMGNSKTPIDIKSESMSLDYKDHSILWTGHVHVNQANAQVTSDNLRVNYVDKDFKQMKDMVADGNVRISQGTRWATGGHAVMDQTKRTVVLTKSPVVHDGTDQITGSRITVYLDTGRSVVEGAHAIIFPHQGEEADNTTNTTGQ